MHIGAGLNSQPSRLELSATARTKYCDGKSPPPQQDPRKSKTSWESEELNSTDVIKRKTCKELLMQGMIAGYRKDLKQQS